MVAARHVDVALPDEEATLAFGALVAKSLGQPPQPAILLVGELGAGKTTLVRGLVAALPGGAEAEVASPSFNICNRYPTTPPVAHYDLYRLEGLPPDEELLDDFSEPELLVIVEWSQYLEPRHRPPTHVRLALSPANPGRLARLEAQGPEALALLERIGRDLGRDLGRESDGADLSST